jgi:hypothetical protein
MVERRPGEIAAITFKSLHNRDLRRVVSVVYAASKPFGTPTAIAIQRHGTWEDTQVDMGGPKRRTNTVNLR